MNISLRQLRVFQAVADCRNFSRAGHQVGLTQPAVSRCIRELESQIGVQLLNRTTREVELTDAGRSLAGRLDRLLDELDLALMDVRDLATQRRGKVRVASSPTLSTNMMPGCIARCAALYPGIHLVLLDRIQQEVMGCVRSGEVDFGVVIDPSDAEDLHCEVISTEPFCLVCTDTHPLARGKSVHWRALSGHPLVLLDYASGSRRLIDQALQRHGVQCEVRQSLSHPTTIFRMVETGIGITVLPTMALPSADTLHTQGLTVRPLTPRVDRDIMLVHRKNRALPPMVQSVWDLVRDMARGDGTAPRGRPRPPADPGAPTA